MMGHGRGSRSGASPGLLRRRYSVPETVMRKYKLAQQKSESEESEVGSAPSPRGQSPARGEARLGASRATERGPRSALLRRLLGREPVVPLGGSHSELRYWDSRSGSSSPRQPRSPERTCEACKRLSDKNLTSITRAEVHAPPMYKNYINHSSRSPKRQKLNSTGSSGQSPERYITMLENARTETLARESSQRQTTSPSTLMAGVSSPSERSSFKSVTLSEGSPKLRLSSLATSSYPATEGNSVSEVSSNMTRSSASYSSDDTSQCNVNKISHNRPLTADDISNNELPEGSVDPKKRRRSVCIYMNSLDSPSVEIKSESVTDSSAPLVTDSIMAQESGQSSTENKTYSTFETGQSTETTPTILPTTSSSTSEKTTTTESSNSTVNTSTRKETTSPSDSAMSMHTSDSNSFNGTDDKPKSGTPSSSDTRHDEDNQNNRNNNRGRRELSDTGISGTIETECDSNKNSYDEVDHNLSKPGSAANSDECSTDINSDMVTCIENSTIYKFPHGNLKSSYIECLEVVVSETLNSSAFSNNKKSEPAQIGDMSNRNQEVESDHQKSVCSIADIDQYVSNILIDSLNTMTDQINEINSNIDDDLKLNILEKEIKVKLQSVNASPINFTNNSIITSLLTHIPDKELLETTVIEEKTRSLAYTTESKMFPLESSTELQEKRSVSDNYMNTLKEEFLENNNVNEEKMPPFSDSNILYENEKYQEILNNNVETHSYENGSKAPDSIDKTFYLANADFRPSDLNENEEVSHSDVTSKAVLQQLHKIFENSPQHTIDSQSTDIDTNFNYCDKNPTNPYFCQSAYSNVSHLEMSTDVDVFVDNSLNKMMNSIDIDYNSAGLCKDIQNMTIESCQKGEGDDLNTKLSMKNDIEPSSEIVSKLELQEDKGNINIISNVGTGSIYQKPLQKPLVVPRYSAIPHSQSMEVNTSSDEDSSCESDCVSLVDSLDDPSSPRQPLTSKERVKQKVSKHDKQLVRGDIMSLLPENSTVEIRHSKEKSETFFVPIKEDMPDCNKDVVVSEHMPEKIREKLLKREQKRELRKEHYKRKRMKQLKKDLQQQKIVEMQKIKDEHEKECVEILSLLIDQVTEKVAKDEKKKSNKDQKPILTSKKSSNEAEKKPTQTRKNSLKVEKNSKKTDTSEFESFVVDKQGNIQMKTSKKSDDFVKTKLNDGKIDFMYDNSAEHQRNNRNSVERAPNTRFVKSKNGPEYKECSFDPNLTGPRRLYQKTEFKEGNRHVEILEIVECIDSSPEPSDDSQDFSSSLSNNSRSKIPIPVHEKFHKISKNKTMQKSSKNCKSPVNKNGPLNTATAKGDLKSYKSTNPKMDQLIANILIEAFNEDNPDNRELQILSPRDRKSNETSVKKLTLPAQTPLRRASIPQQNTANHDKVSTLPKYQQRFDAIPEERSSVSVESSNEEINSNNANRRASLPAKIKMNQAKTPSPLIDSKKSVPSGEDSENNFTKSVENNISMPDLRCSLTVVDEIVPNSNKSDVETQIDNHVSSKKPEIHDVSTSPMPQYISTATSPIPLAPVDDNKCTDQSHPSKQMKGKKALTTRDGWAGFCRPQNGFSPEHEGSLLSSNNPPDREVFEKMKDTNSVQSPTSDSKKIAPPSQRILRTMDSRNNIRQISILHEVGDPDKKSKNDYHKESTSKVKDKNKERNNNHSNNIISQDTGSKMSAKIDKSQKKNGKELEMKNEKSGQVTDIDSENQSGTSFTVKHGNRKKTETKMQRSESRDSTNSKSLKLPSPFRNQSSTQSSESTSSGSDSEVGVTCPQLVPRWLPNAVPRYRRTVNRRPQRQDDQFHLPYQNIAGGWSVTLQGSCYTALPTDVEMKVSFPKNNQQQATSQSDSGLGEEHNNYKKQGSAAQSLCKKCGNRENLCQNCQSSPNCKCIATIVNQPETESENQSFLPPAQIRKMSRSSKIEDDGSVDPIVNSSKKYFQYLPDVNTMPSLRNRPKKSSMKMARRFSLHCWLPEDKPIGRQKVAKMEITETIMPENTDELSVLGCAIMPEMKPRVPTMSERDLTRVQTAQFYSRNRHL